MTVKIHDAVFARIEAGAKAGVKQATELLHGEVRRLVLNTPKLGRQYGSHTASAPGQPYASETGDTLGKVVTEYANNGKTGKVTALGANAVRMELGTERMAPRPALRPAVENTRHEVELILKYGIRNSLGGRK